MTELRDQLQTTLTGTYSIERELGGGGMSRVFLADEMRLGRKVVVKVLSPDLAAGISAERFEQEIKLAASLQQANIVPVLSAGDTNGLPFYTMPFVEGESLRARISQGPPLPTADLLRILGDVARALQYAHDRGIVHRDIKPDNVLLSGGTAVVTDFGIAKALSAAKRNGEMRTSAMTMVGTSIGTPMYMAPEQAAGDPDVDHRADIYAFGCMAYELLTGQPPFHSRTPQRILAAHMSEVPKPLGDLRPDVPATLRDLVMQCLAKDADARPQKAADIVRALDAVTSAGGMDAMPRVLLHGPGAFRKAMLVYVACAIGVVVVAKAATMVIGLPPWVVPAAIFVMLLGLPVILFTGYVQSVTRRTLTVTPAMTPGGGTQGHGTMATIALKASPHLSWKRATRGGIYAFATFVLLVVGVMVSRATGIGPFASLFASGVMTEKDQVLVADFDAPASDSSIGTVVSEAIRSSLADSKAIRIVPSSQIVAGLGRMQKAPTTRVDYAVARDLAQREGYKAIIDGKVTPVSGGGFIVTARLVAAATGDEMASFRQVAKDAERLIPAIDKLTKDLRGRIGESLRSVQAAPTLAHATTTSLPALRKFTEGGRANSIEQDYLKAIAALEEAIRLDTAFAQAYRLLATAYSNAGLKPERADSLRAKAFALREQLPEAERHLVEGAYYGAGSHVDRQKTLAAYRKVLELEPDNTSALHAAAGIARGMRQFTLADSLWREAMRISPTNAFYRTSIAMNLLSMGRVDEATQAWQEFQKISPNNPSPIRFVVIANKFGIDSARTDCAAAAKSENLQRRSDAYSCVAAIELTHGRVDDALRNYRRLIDADSARGVKNIGFELAYRSTQALTAAWFFDRGDEAARIIDDIVPGIPLKDPPPAMATAPATIVEAYALANRPDKARAYFNKWMASLDTTRQRQQSTSIHFAEARIAVAEKNYDRAIGEFFKADTLYDGQPTGCNGCIYAELGRAYDLAGRHDQAIASWEKYLATPYPTRWSNRDPVYLAGIYKRLGELYEEKGQPTKAIGYLNKFIDLWKNADAGLQPKVADARARVARLQKLEAKGR